MRVGKGEETSSSHQSDKHSVEPSKHIRTIVCLGAEHGNTCHQHSSRLLVESGSDVLNIDGRIHPADKPPPIGFELIVFKEEIRISILTHFNLNFLTNTCEYMWIIFWLTCVRPSSHGFVSVRLSAGIAWWTERSRDCLEESVHCAGIWSNNTVVLGKTILDIERHTR